MTTKIEGLKTLKDIRSIWKCECGEIHAHADLDELEQEAIKWIKEFDAQIKENREEVPYKVGYIQDWIKHFFNITEEDLK